MTLLLLRVLREFWKFPTVAHHDAMGRRYSGALPDWYGFDRTVGVPLDADPPVGARRSAIACSDRRGIMAVIVDSGGSAEVGRHIAEAVGRITDKPVTHVVKLIITEISFDK